MKPHTAYRYNVETTNAVVFTIIPFTRAMTDRRYYYYYGKKWCTSSWRAWTESPRVKCRFEPRNKIALITHALHFHRTQLCRQDITILILYFHSPAPRFWTEKLLKKNPSVLFTSRSDYNEVTAYETEYNQSHAINVNTNAWIRQDSWVTAAVACYVNHVIN